MSSFDKAVSLIDNQVAGALSQFPVLVGLDGFVDTILHVVAQRQTATEYTRMTETREFASRISDAAGRSANFEFIPKMVKLGGNGPIMANAFCSFGVPVTYLGNLGSPNIDAVFSDFAARCERVVSVAEPARTDAIEFEDGKLMCGKSETLKDVNWENILQHLPLEELKALFARSPLVSLVNWTMILHMSDILRSVLRDIAPTLPPAADGQKRWLFFDLADPAKRTRDDIADFLEIAIQFQKHFRVILGLNYQEARQIGGVLGMGEPGESPASVAEYATRIRERMHIETVVIHPTHFAAASDATGEAHVAGPYTPRPLITTGAGDHFNAGFCLGRLLGGGLEESLSLGVGTSGFYVRKAKSPTLAELRGFLAEN